jgi:hypothetical protein
VGVLSGVPLQLWNSKALEAIGNELGRFIKVDDQALKAPDKRLCKVLVEIDIHSGLLEMLEIEWQGHVVSQRLDYLGVPFSCSLCRWTGHLRRDCLGMEVEEESESSMLRKVTREASLEVDSFVRSPIHTTTEDSRKLTLEIMFRVC